MQKPHICPDFLVILPFQILACVLRGTETVPHNTDILYRGGCPGFDTLGPIFLVALVTATFVLLVCVDHQCEREKNATDWLGLVVDLFTFSHLLEQQHSSGHLSEWTLHIFGNE